MSLPKDPIILLSYINTKLRDNYSSLDEMCEDLDYNKNQILSALGSIDYCYVLELNRFTPNL